MMTLIAEWIRNIIVFIIFATLLDMLLPSSTLGKYVQFVIGLLLFVLLAAPLFEVFKMPVQEALERVIFSNGNEENVQNRMEEKKIEIQARQHAYILEQMAVQLKKQVNPILMEDFQVEMMSGEFDASVSEKNTLEEIHQLRVVVQKTKEEMIQDVSVVESIRIGKPAQNTGNDNHEMDKRIAAVQDFLAKELGIEREKIEVIQEGEEG